MSSFAAASCFWTRFISN